MLTESGYVKQCAIRRIGERKRTLFNIVYDREYLIRSVGRIVCKPMFVLGKEKTLELVSEAWDDYYQNHNSKYLHPVGMTNDNYTKVQS